MLILDADNSQPTLKRFWIVTQIVTLALHYFLTSGLTALGDTISIPIGDTDRPDTTGILIVTDCTCNTKF